MHFSRILLPFCASFAWTVISCASGTCEDEETGFRQRSALLQKTIADEYRPPSMDIGDPEKYYWPKAMARMEQYGVEDSMANEWILQLSDHSPFHFTMVGMARILHRYAGAPGLEASRTKILKRAFERVDSHNPWTGEGTENHTHMARCSGYLHAQAALEYPGIFPDAREKMDLMKQWIMEWSRKMYRYGTGEFNSSIYQAYSVISWLNLYDFARDREVRLAARAVLDYFAAETALHYSWGTTGGSEMRGSGAQNSNRNATNYLAWLWFGEGTREPVFGISGNQYIQSIHAITSQYRPPSQVVDLARKQKSSESWYRGSKPEYLFAHPSYVKQFFFVEADHTLGSCISPYGGWTGTTFQMVNWKLVIRPDPGELPLEVGGNGRYFDEWSGKSTNPFTQVFQHRNTLIQLTLTPANAREIQKVIISTVEEWKRLWKRDFDRRFPQEAHKGKSYQIINYVDRIAGENQSYINLPDQIRTVRRGDLFCVEIGRSCLAIRLIGHPAKGEPLQVEGKTARGRRFLIAEEAPGRLCGLVLEVHPQRDFSCLECFADQVEEHTRLDLSRANTDHLVRYTNLGGDLLEMQYVTGGSFSEATVDWGFGPVTPRVSLHSPPFFQPDWPSGPGYGRVPRVKVNGSEVDFAVSWPVFDGPGMRLKEGILEIGNRTADSGDPGVSGDPGEIYRVDYSGRLPRFSS